MLKEEEEEKSRLRIFFLAQSETASLQLQPQQQQRNETGLNDSRPELICWLPRFEPEDAALLPGQEVVDHRVGGCQVGRER